jgi:sphingomyelin phosphodiesterase acid-like 3
LGQEIRTAHGFEHPRRVFLLLLIGLAAADIPARAAEPSGIVAVVSDIYSNLFAAPDLTPRLVSSDPKEWPIIFASRSAQGFSSRGEDTNHALLASTLVALSANAGSADLAILSGDLPAHHFEEVAAQVLGTSPTSSDVRELAAKTVLYVADAVRTALPGRPILVALGNNDFECGDYQLEPGGPSSPPCLTWFVTSQGRSPRAGLRPNLHDRWLLRARPSDARGSIDPRCQRCAVINQLPERLWHERW